VTIEELGSTELPWMVGMTEHGCEHKTA